MPVRPSPKKGRRDAQDFGSGGGGAVDKDDDNGTDGPGEEEGERADIEQKESGRPFGDCDLI